MKQLCLGNVGFSNTSYETFLNSVVDLSPANTTVEQTRVIRATYFKGHQIFLSRSANLTAIQQLRKQYGAAVPEYEGLAKLTAQLETQKIPGLVKALADGETNRIAAEKELPQVRSTFGGLETALKSSREKFDRNAAIIAPFQNEAGQLQGQIDQANEQIATADSQVSNAHSSIQANTSRIASLRSEASDEESNRSAANSGLYSAKSTLDSAKRATQLFDREGKIRERQQSQFGYDSYFGTAQELESARRVLAVKDQDVSNIDREKRDADRAVSECMKTGGECAAERANVSQKDRDLNAAKSAQSNAASNVQSKQESLTRIDERIRSEVNAEYEKFVSKESEAQAAVNDLESAISNAQSRMDSINNTEIPNAQGEISRAQSDLQNLANVISQATADLKQAKANFSTLR